jgi:hypothetical protein
MEQQNDRPRDRLLTSLIVEVFQAERSGAEHAPREAQRLGDTPPGRVMRDIGDDCRRALEELRGIASRPDIPQGSFGERIGSMFSALREGVGDVFVSRQMSYRGTLLGVHHGVDAIMLLRSAAENAGDVEVVEWCMRVLDGRLPLLERAQHELTWFAREPARAMEPAKRTLFAKGARIVATGLGAIGLNRSVDR